MKLLLTSAGISNKSIADALLELSGKATKEIRLAFVPTAANVEEGDKGWLIDDLGNCKKQGYASVDIVDFSAISRDMWEKRLREANVLLFGGGNTFHLMYYLEKSGLKDLLPELLKDRVYVGISAGSMVATKNLSISQAKKLYYDDVEKNESDIAMGFVDFLVRPHLNSPHFPKVTDEYLTELAKEIPDTVYALDDNSAVKVVDEKVEVISEGKWKKYN